MDHLYYFCLVLRFHARLFIDASWSPAGKGLGRADLLAPVCDV